MKRVSTVLLAIAAGTAGLIVLLSYFLDLPYLSEVSQWLKQTAVLLGAAALLVGLFNLISVHLGKIGGQEKGWAYSALLVVMLAVTFTLGMLFGIDNRSVTALFRYIQLPVESTLIALLAVSLTAAGYRLIARRASVFNSIFMITAILFILGSIPWLILPGWAGAFGILRIWLAEVWAVGGARGLLLGVALGSITAGLRVLLAADRPYGD